MPTNYQGKYIACMKVYHQLHAELSELTMKLIARIKDMKISPDHKAMINEVIYEGADRVKENYLKFNDIVRTKWKQPNGDNNGRSNSKKMEG